MNYSADNTKVARCCSTASINREGGPLYSVPETSVLVSTTSFTRGAFGADFIHDLLDFVHGHRSAGKRAKVPGHLKKIAAVLVLRQFARNQLGQMGRVEQAFGPRLGNHGLGQIKLNGDAHNVLLAEGYRGQSPPRPIHTDKGPAFVPRAAKTKHPLRAKVKPGGAR